MSTLTGRVALVTGAGRGIGKAIAVKLGAAGASLVLNDLTADITEDAAVAVRAAGGRAVTCVGDVTREDFPDRFVSAALDSFGSIDIVVNNAGYATYADVVEMSDSRWQPMLDVLLTAPFRILRAAGGYFRDTANERGVRKVVNVASVGGIVGSPGSAGYAAAKAGLLGLTRTLAKEWGRHGVTVNAIAPGLIRTRLTEGPVGGYESIEISGERLPLVGVPLDDLEKQIPLGRIGAPEDVANAAYLLCLPESDYVTGEVLVVSGGWMPDLWTRVARMPGRQECGGLTMTHKIATARTAEEGKNNLDKYGYTVHEDFLSSEELSALRDRLEEQAEMERAAGVAVLSSSGHAGSDKYIGAPREGSRVGYQEVKFLVNKGRVFLDLLHKPVIHQYAEHLFRGEPYNAATHSGVFLEKGSSRQVLHADQQAIPVALDRPVMFVMMVCLSDFQADMGATLVAPGSHRFRSPELGTDADEQVRAAGSELVPLTAKAGSALFWESRTWHAQGASTSDNTRVSIGVGWALHFIKPQDFFPAIVHDDVYDGLSERDKELLGFRVIREYSGRIAPRTPDDRRMNTNMRYPYVPELAKGGRKRAVPLELMERESAN